ncbi:MAG: FISUMP domain-containing protein, partial [Myxococcota bacterium]
WLPNTTVLLMRGSCYSGQTSTLNLPEGEDTPIATAWMSRDPIAYYGYELLTGQSLPVASDWCFERETALVRALVDGDATEEAHLDPAGNEYDGGISELERRRYGDLFFRFQGQPGYCFDPCTDTFVDVRDDHVYGCTCIGDQIWMTENLVYAWPGAASAPTDPTGERFGFFYDLWTLLDGAAGSNRDPSGVQGLCPDGWHVPSDVEWQRMELHVGVQPDELTDPRASRGLTAQSGRVLKAEDGWATPDGLDAAGFGAVGTGFVLLDGAPPYIGEGVLTTFATTTTIYDADAERWQASYRLLYDDDPGIWYGLFDIFESDDVTPDRNLKVSARCVKDPEPDTP